MKRQLLILSFTLSTLLGFSQTADQIIHSPNDSIFLEVIDSSVDSYILSIANPSKSNTHPADWLSGSWGVTFPVYGGERLDSEVAGGYNYRAGVQEIVDELPAVGHVITNLSNFAKSYYFTLRSNANVDIAAEIDELLVPSLENEQIIFDVLQKFKDSGKKNILYISTNYFDRLGPNESDNVDFNEAHAAWVTYYTNNFAGNEYLAYKDLIQGFVLRVKDYTDGYWLDTTSDLHDDGHLEDFVQMIKDADPDAIMGAQPEGLYFTYENGDNILVDSDGIDDDDDRDYKVIKFEANCTYQDFTKGHVTPLGQGAPPNSWGYEEYTIPSMVENPWSVFEGNTVLSHAWFPMRNKWHVSSADLQFGTEDAYRFTKKLVDADAAITFATTIDDIGDGKGYMMRDEMDIMKTINDRLISNPMMDYESYVRPEGAHLVGEETNLYVNSVYFFDLKMYPNPVKDKLTITRTSKDVAHIIIVSSIGKKEIEIDWNYGSNTMQLDMSSLSSGVYFINISDKKGKEITKSVIVSE